MTGSLVVFAGGDGGVHGRERREVWGWRGAMVGWSVAGFVALWESK